MGDEDRLPGRSSYQGFRDRNRDGNGRDSDSNDPRRNRPHGSGSYARDGPPDPDSYHRSNRGGGGDRGERGGANRFSSYGRNSPGDRESYRSNRGGVGSDSSFAPRPSRPREPSPSQSDQQPKRPRFEPSAGGSAGASPTATEANQPRTSAKEGPRGEPDKSRPSRRDRELDIVVSRDSQLATKKGVIGEVIKLTCNFFRLERKPTWLLYQYRVDFEPPIETLGIRKRLLFLQKPVLGGYLYDGQSALYLTHRLEPDPYVVEAKDREENSYKVTVKRVAVVNMNTKESLMVLNIILRRAMDGLKLELIGRNFFDPKAKVVIHGADIQLWPGYVTSIRQHETDVMLCAEITNKVMRTETVYDIMNKLKRENGNFKERFEAEVLGMTVLTEYNNKTYRVDDINWDVTPGDTFESKKEKKQISFVDYYQSKYRLNIRDHKQPLLVSKCKEKDIRGGQDKTVLLVPELCHVTGLSEAMRKNFGLMKSMACHFRMNPMQRTQKLLDFNRRLARTPESMEVLKQFNFSLSPSLVTVDGRILKKENIVFGDNRKVAPSDRADWNMAFRDNAMAQSVPLTNWVYMYPYRNSREANDFLKALQQAARGMRYELHQPNVVQINDDRNHTYVDQIERCLNTDPKLIMILVPNNNSDRYANIKKKCCVDRAVATQVLCQRTITPKKGNLLSIATKVAIQINCKLGGAAWKVEMPLTGLMTVGFDVSHDTKDRSKSYGALVACMDMREGVNYFSAVSAHRNGEELSNDLCLNMTKALQEFRHTSNGALPKKIIVYRDGVGEGQTQYVLEYEVALLREKLDAIYKSVGDTSYNLCFVVVSKRINARFFLGNFNPPPGTVVDDVVTLPERYDFFLVSQSVNQGTVSPTSYNVLYDNMGLPPDRLQQLTYKLTHMYYNWSGTTRVPAVCQYAHKLAFLVGQFIHQSPSNVLERQLYFL